MGGFGGAIYNHSADLLIEFATFAYNSPDGILNDSSGNVTMRSSILAHHAAANCTGVGYPSLGFNLETDDNCNLIEPSELTNTDPPLEFLALNGGTNLSHALNLGSPAIVSGDPDKCTSEDQRGVTRPQGVLCDRGAYEVASVVVPVTPLPLGTVTGRICFPSEYIPPLTLYSEEINTNTVKEFEHDDGADSYSVDLSPGTYVAYAYQTGTSIGGSYSQSVPCGLRVNCIDYSLIEFQVLTGQITSDIDICDYYGDPGYVPAPPGGLPYMPTPTATSALSFVTATFIVNANCRQG